MKLELRATATGSRARATTITTLHGDLATPVFMPVGTRGSVRTQPLAQLERLAPPIILANTYHLMMRPGRALFEQLGGLHRWIGWDRAILTDSGGFQVFSLGGTVTEEGATVTNPDDGTQRLLTPESSIAMQRALGSDIMMVFDHCIDSTSSHAESAAAMQLTHRWAARSLAARGDSPQALFAIVQGACFEDLRRASAAALSEHAFDGFAIGGLAVGEGRAQREDITELTAQLLPADRPRYLMGVGTPLDLLEAVHRGVDMFDCTLPTSLAQQGVAFTSRGKVDLRRGSYKLADVPLDAACDCDACARHSRSYLHHLVKAKEPVGWQLLAFHNLRFYLRLMERIRAAIADDTFAAFHAEQREILAVVDQDNPPGPRPKARAGKPTTRGGFTLHRSTLGFTSIQHVGSGEIMHPVHDPDAEAERLYIAQSVLLAQARPLVVWDVGLGAAHNAMALLRNARAPVTLISFERDLDPLRLALEHLDKFPHLRHAAPHRLAATGSYTDERITWQLCEGDFLTTFADQPAPDVIFYDPFSAKVDTPMWSLATFRALYAHLTRATELFTYSTSTAVRSSLLAAGFHVARGAPSAPKEETTIALRFADGVDLSAHALLGRDWLARRARSTARFGADVPADQHHVLEHVLEAHAQFSR